MQPPTRSASGVYNLIRRIVRSFKTCLVSLLPTACGSLFFSFLFLPHQPSLLLPRSFFFFVSTCLTRSIWCIFDKAVGVPLRLAALLRPSPEMFCSSSLTLSLRASLLTRRRKLQLFPVISLLRPAVYVYVCVCEQPCGVYLLST